MNDPFNWLIVVMVICAILAFIALGPIVAWLVVIVWALFSSA